MWQKKKDNVSWAAVRMWATSSQLIAGRERELIWNKKVELLLYFSL